MFDHEIQLYEQCGAPLNTGLSAQKTGNYIVTIMNGTHRYGIIILSLAVLILASCHTFTEIGDAHAEVDSAVTAQPISDIELYEMCSKDLSLSHFDRTPCGIYLQGFITAYALSSISSASQLPAGSQDIALSKIGICDRSKLPLRGIAERFVEYAEGIPAYADKESRHLAGTGVFFFHYVDECNSMATPQAEVNARSIVPNEEITSFYSFDYKCCDSKVRYVREAFNLLEMQSTEYRIGIIEVDLNGDRQIDFLAQIHSPVHCGSGGCALHIFLNQGDENYVEVKGPTVTYWDVGVSKQEKNHMRNLIFKSKDGGDCVWAWNRTEYRLVNCAKER